MLATNSISERSDKRLLGIMDFPGYRTSSIRINTVPIQAYSVPWDIYLRGKEFFKNVYIRVTESL